MNKFLTYIVFILLATASHVLAQEKITSVDEHSVGSSRGILEKEIRLLLASHKINEHKMEAITGKVNKLQSTVERWGDKVSSYKENNERFYSNTSSSLSDMKWLVAFVLSVTAMLLGAGTFYIVKENSNISTRIKIMEKAIDMEYQETIAKMERTIKDLEKKSRQRYQVNVSLIYA